MDLRKGAAVDLRRGRAYLCVASEGRSTDRRGEAPQYFHHSEMPPPSPLDARVGGLRSAAHPAFLHAPAVGGAAWAAGAWVAALGIGEEGRRSEEREGRWICRGAMV